MRRHGALSPTDQSVMQPRGGSDSDLADSQAQIAHLRSCLRSPDGAEEGRGPPRQSASRCRKQARSSTERQDADVGAGLTARPHTRASWFELLADDEGQARVTGGVVLRIARRERRAERVRAGLEDELDVRGRLARRVGRADRGLASELEVDLLAGDGLTVLVHERRRSRRPSSTVRRTAGPV